MRKTPLSRNTLFRGSNYALRCSQLFGYIRALTGRGEAPLQAAILDAPGAGGSVRPASTNQIEDNGQYEYALHDRRLWGARDRIRDLGEPIGDDQRSRQQENAGDLRGR